MISENYFIFLKPVVNWLNCLLRGEDLIIPKKVGGIMTSFERIRHPDACSAVIYNEQQHILLVKIKFKKGRWQLPGGLIERGEAPWEACTRLIEEEVGVKSTIDGLAGIYYRPNKDDNIFIFYATVESQTFKLSEEIEEASFFAIDNLPTPMNAPTIERINACFQSPKVVMKTHHSN